MKESHRKDPASHPDPESCVGGREDAGEALTGEHAGQPLSSEITLTGVPTPYGEGEGNMADGANASRPPTPGDTSHPLFAIGLGYASVPADTDFAESRRPGELMRGPLGLNRRGTVASPLDRLKL